MELFRSGRVDVLVATDVASRGLDIAAVGCVINYNVPDDPLIYFHRVGRTARAGQAGRSYTLVSPEEFDDFSRILETTKARIKPMRPEDEKHAIEIGSRDAVAHRRGGRRAGPSQGRFRRNPYGPRRSR
jgi:ATP-dependent RNA helicase DeaD